MGRRLVDRAVQRGLVRKSSDSADGRSVRVGLTAEAQALKSGVIAEIGDLLAPLTDRLTPGEQKRLAGLLMKALDQ